MEAFWAALDRADQGEAHSGKLLADFVQLLTDLIQAIHEHDQAQFKGFLVQVTGHLDSVKAFILQSEQSDEQGLNQVAAFNKTLQSDIHGIHQRLSQTTTLEDLTQHLSSGLMSILDRVNQHCTEETHRIETIALEKKTLMARMSETEKMAERLQVTLMQERECSKRDVLTGLFNRVAYQDRLEEEFQRWKRDHLPFAIAVSDIDFFKKVNDSYGHSAGDKVLKIVSDVFKRNTRSTDFIARYGGEEFVFLIRNSPANTVVFLLNKIRKHVESLQFHVDQVPVQVTVSFGMTLFVPGDTTVSAFDRADKALYKAKAQGRNRVETLLDVT